MKSDISPPSPSGPSTGAIIWLTGLSGSGKTTIATALERALRQACRGVCVLDGDELRRSVNSDLGFSPEDRAENVRRVAEIARLMAQAGLMVVVALISPFHKDRHQARSVAAASGIDFIEVYLDCPLEICERRDPKGLYKKARTGNLAAFTGIDSGYETPQHAEIVLSTGTQLESESIRTLLEFLGARFSPDSAQG
ncbi:adenylyl-sulfate kinase [Chthoniobacter flavus]|uniref:adenylyl-sulfate kinase n=1 Tax=Chthoniobacter flavus TaxID=191863 RepID=UPI00192B00AD|nr:adenylyl-sulfate kinase [Chthoniobacter flavus]